MQLHPPRAAASLLQPPLLCFVVVLRNLKLLNGSTQKSSSISKPHLLPALNHQIHYIWHWPVCEGCLHQSPAYQMRSWDARHFCWTDVPATQQVGWHRNPTPLDWLQSSKPSKIHQQREWNSYPQLILKVSETLWGAEHFSRLAAGSSRDFSYLPKHKLSLGSTVCCFL